MRKNKNEDKKVYEKLLVQSVLDDFERRKQERKIFEAQWQLNMNFLRGNQYCDVKENLELFNLKKQFFWQHREVYNHIAPTVERRISRLNKIRPKIDILPITNEEKDISSAKISKKIIDSVYNKLDLSFVIGEVTKWSEICGTGFYKIIWNSNKGNVISNDYDGSVLKSGDIEISAISPFEIYPESSTSQNLEDCRSLIHARAYHVDEIKSKWGIDVDGEDVNVFTFDKISGLNFNSTENLFKTVRSNYAIVLEKYEAPSKNFPNGRLIIVVKDKLVFDGDLPFKNGEDETRTFPFVKQCSIPEVGCFWGVSIIQRMIPLQKSYNAIKNRKHEFLNRLSMGILNVEDGSVDVETLEDDGLCPGKVLVYRQGANPPKYLENSEMPFDFTAEEKSLLNEFAEISGIVDISNESYLSKNMSGIALERIIEQDENKILITSDSIKNAIKLIAKNILRLYKQFVKFPKLVKFVGEKGKLEMFYFDSSDISTDDVVLDTKNELVDSLSQRKDSIIEMLKAGILNDDGEKMSGSMKTKILDMLGYDILNNYESINDLQRERARKENNLMKNEQFAIVSQVDDHEIHINEHTIFLLKFDINLSEKDKKIREIIEKHIEMHRQMKTGE